MEAIIFVGLQASGKSTFYKERFFDTHVRINLDMLRTRHRERLLLQACIEMKQRFVVDNTNPTPAQRAGYIAQAKAAGLPLSAITSISSVSECIARNNRREGAARIPVSGHLREREETRKRRPSQKALTPCIMCGSRAREASWSRSESNLRQTRPVI